MEGYDAEMFVPSEFKETTFDFDGIQQRLYCSHAATTDYDLTGQIVWPASQVLGWYLRQTKATVEGKHVVEVGAGCGLVGGVAKQCGAASVTLTDGSPHVIDLLKRTHTLNQWKESEVEVHQLKWGEEEAAQKLIETLGAQGKRPTVILGADVFQTSFGSPQLLFKTVKQFFRAAADHGLGSECAFVACFGLRATTKEDLIAQCAEQEGVAIHKVCIRDMLPSGMHPDDFTKEKLRLIKYTLV